MVGVEQILGSGRLVDTRDAFLGGAPAAGRHQLHQSIGRRAADRKRIEIAFGAHDCEHQARAHMVLDGVPVDAAAIALGATRLEVLHHGEVDEPRGAAAFIRRHRPRLGLVRHEVGRVRIRVLPRRYRLALAVVDQAIQIRPAGGIQRDILVAE